MPDYALAFPGSIAYRVPVEKTVQKFRTFEESDSADVAYYRSLAPSERIDILLELIAQTNANETEPRLERVYRIVELSRS